MRYLLLLSLALPAAASDSLRVLLLENKVAQMEMEKVRAQEQSRIASMEAEVKRLATRQVTVDNQSLWTAGDKVQSSIWLNLAGSGCLFLAQVAAADESYGLAFLGLAGAVTLNIIGVVKLYGAGTSLKRASNSY